MGRRRNWSIAGRGIGEARRISASCKSLRLEKPPIVLVPKTKSLNAHPRSKRPVSLPTLRTLDRPDDQD